MRGLLENLFDTSRYSSAILKDRARMVYGIGLLMFGIAIVGAVVYRSPTGGETLWVMAASQPIILFYLGFFVVMAAASVLVTRYGYIGMGGMILIVMWSISLGFSSAQLGLYTVYSGMFLILIIMMGGLLNGRTGLIVGTSIAVFMLLYGLSRRESAPPPTIDTGSDLVLGLIAFMAVVGITYLFLRFASLSRSEGEAAAIEHRLRIAEVNTQMSRRVARRVTLTELLNGLVEHICSEFPDIYHAQVFLIEPGGENARLAASTGEVGKELIARQHSLAIGSLSVIGQVTLQGTPIIARADSKDSVHRRNEFLPDTAVEAAFPLRIGNVIIGALDLQSKNPAAFSRRLVDAFLSLSDSIALAIDNVRQFERAEARIQENQQLVEQTRSALREVERLNERLTGRAWSEYLRGRSDQLGLDVDFETRAVSHDDQWTPGLREAVQSDQLVQEQHADRQVIAMPLHVRGQIVGAMEFELDPERAFTPEDLSLIQEIGERFGLAAENTRLVEESQRIAQREALVNEISSRLQAANNVETTLMEAARSLRDTLKAGRVAIRLGAPPEQNGA